MKAYGWFADEHGKAQKSVEYMKSKYEMILVESKEQASIDSGIIEDSRLVDQYRFPRSKKKRIRNKWAKDPRNFMPSRRVCVAAGVLICHPVVAAEIRQKIAKEMAERVDEAFLKYVMSGDYNRCVQYHARGGS